MAVLVRDKKCPVLWQQIFFDKSKRQQARRDRRHHLQMTEPRWAVAGADGVDGPE